MRGLTIPGVVEEAVKDIKQEIRGVKNEIEHVRRLLNQTDRKCVTAKPGTDMSTTISPAMPSTVQTTTASTPDHGITVEPSRQARVAALRCEYFTLCYRNVYLQRFTYKGA